MSSSASPSSVSARRRVGSFLLWLGIITGVSEGVVALVASSGFAGSPLARLLQLVVSWSPALAALAASRSCGRPLAEIGWRRPRLRYFSIAYTLPLAYALATYGLVWVLGWGHFPHAEHLAKMTAMAGVDHLSPSWALAALVVHHATVLWLLGCISSLGEEIGWRGFLLPELVQVLPFRSAVICGGLVWAAWHYPLILLGGYHGYNHMLYSIACFTLVITAMSFPLAWLRLKSGEVWTSTVFHVSHNLFILKLFNPLTQDTGPTRWLVSEFGIVTVVMTLFTAWVFRSVKPAADTG